MTQRIDRIGKFEIIERLGEGSLGEVFLARDTIIGREVALKIIRRTALLGPEPEARFLRENQALSRLSHPNLVTIHEFGEKDGLLYQALDFVPGPDLGALMRDHALTPKEALDHLAQVCDGLAYAHQHGILHRNLKPANVRIGRVAGRPAAKLLDYGLSRAPGSDTVAIAAQLASLACTAPECLHGGKYDGRADLFAVGVMLYEALTGTQPFDADNPAEVIRRVREEEPPDLDPARFPDLSPAIQAVLRQALAKDPARRFATAEAMAEALRGVQNPSWSPHREPQWALKPGIPLPIPPRPEPPRPAHPHATAAWAAVVILLAVLGGGGGAWWWAHQRSRRVAPPPLPATVASPLQPMAPETPAQASAPGQADAAPPQPAPVPPQPAPVPSQPAPVPPQPAPVPTHALAATPTAPVQARPQAAPAPVPVPAAGPRAGAEARPQGPGARPAQGEGAPKRAYATLDDAAAAVDKDPEGALAFLDPAVVSDPGNEQALAHRIVALYNLKRYGACTKAIREARKSGHPLWPMAMKQPALRRMLERDAKDPHLPRKKPAAPEGTPEPANP